MSEGPLNLTHAPVAPPVIAEQRTIRSERGKHSRISCDTELDNRPQRPADHILQTWVWLHQRGGRFRCLDAPVED